MDFILEPTHSDIKAHCFGSKWSKINNRNGDKLPGENWEIGGAGGKALVLIGYM